MPIFSFFFLSVETELPASLSVPTNLNLKAPEREWPLGHHLSLSLSDFPTAESQAEVFWARLGGISPF